MARCLSSGGFVTSTGRFQGVLEPSRTIGDVDVKAEAPKGCIASYPEVRVTCRLLHGLNYRRTKEHGSDIIAALVCSVILIMEVPVTLL